MGTCFEAGGGGSLAERSIATQTWRDAANPAKPSAQLVGLFPSGVAAAELRGFAPVSLLTPAERKSVGDCSGKRLADFAAGRLCARRALQEAGIMGFSLLAGQDRQPQWPISIVGSVTHTEGFCAAVIAPKRDFGGLGVDCEVIDAVTEEVWRSICAPPELARLLRLSPIARRSHAALIFAAKEAFYKCQFPLTNEWIDFEDVTIESDWPALGGTFHVIPCRPVALDRKLAARFVGRFRFHEHWVMTGVMVPPE